MLRHLYWGLVVGTVLCAGAGCSGKSGDDDDNGGSSSDPDAVAKCNNFFDDYCPAIMDCLVEGGSLTAADRDTAVDACVSQAKMTIDCSRAVAVSSTYDACITDLHNLDCTAINAAFTSGDTSNVLPADCKGAVLIQ